MQKLTIFTIVFTVIVLVIVAEIVVNDYLYSNFSANGYAQINEQSSIVNPDFVQTSVIDLDDITREVQEDFNETEINGEQILPTLTNTKKAQPSFQVNYSKLKSAGFDSFRINVLSFKSQIFSYLDLRDTITPEASMLEIVTDPLSRATIYEFQFEDKDDAASFYSLLLSKGDNALGAEANETNKYGDSSFYINPDEKNEQVYLIVRVNSGIYCFRYNSEEHTNIINLINILISNE